MIYDLAIVGAGPGGLYTARCAAKKGLQVILIEKRKDISKVTRYCSEHIILDEDYNGDTITVDTERGKIASTANGWEVDYKGELCPVTDKYYYSPKQNAIHFAWPDRRPFAYKFDKGYLIQSILEECLALGVTYQNESTGYDAIDSPDGVEIKCVSKGKKSTVKAKKLIIADGSISRMAQAMGFNRDRAYLGNALCLATYMSGVKTYNPAEWKGWWGRCYGSNLAPLMGTGPAGHFEWADMVILGSAKDPAEKVFEYFTKKSPMADMFKDAKIEERYCCSVRAFTPIKKPYNGNTLVLGDAAAFVEVQLQGAFSCGLKAAEAIAGELEGKNGFEQYTKWWLDSFEFNSEGMMRVQQGYALIPVYTDDEIDYLFSLCEGITLDGSWSQYKTPKMIWGTILQDPDRIKRERPALFQKIKSARSNSLQESI
jgi:digeranylgeranylglycerophospholipid reductase